MVSRLSLVLSTLLVACGSFDPHTDPDGIGLTITTDHGTIEVLLHPKLAPITVTNFLRYVDAGQYEGGRFHRAVTLDNQPDRRVRIEVIQGGPDPSRRLEGFPPIVIERTSQTGLRHIDGTLSMARNEPDSACSDFFICIGEQPSLNFGGLRNPDGQGFAAFGQVVSGMDVVRAIQAADKDGQRLTPVLNIRSIQRMKNSGAAH